MMNSPNLKSDHYTIYDIKLGRVYLSANFMITEFREGVDINFDNFDEVTAFIKLHFENRPFGFIADRTNSYSIDLKDSTKFNSSFPNLKAYAVVVYKTITERVFEIENHFFKFNRSSFKDLEHAIKWVEETLSTEV
jgi:hypothetical protein